MKTKKVITLLLMSAFCVHSYAQNQKNSSYLASSPYAPEVITAPDSLRPGDTAIFLFETFNLDTPRFEYRISPDGAWTSAATHSIKHSNISVVRLTTEGKSPSSHKELHFRVISGSEFTEGKIPFSE